MPKESKTLKQLQKEIDRLKKLAYRDELTGLYNRHGFKEESEKFIQEVVEFKKNPERRKSFLVKNFSLVIFDIDNFKKLNDTNGHQAGDKALAILGELLRKTVRSVDIVARWGGEEIVLGLVGASNDEAFEIADNIRKKIAENSFKWGRKTISFTVSGGVACLENAGDFETVFACADKALYKAKHNGKNQIVKA